MTKTEIKSVPKMLKDIKSFPHKQNVLFVFFILFSLCFISYSYNLIASRELIDLGPKINLFHKVAFSFKSDRVNDYKYQTLYWKHLEDRRLNPMNILEVGLQCDIAHLDEKSRRGNPMVSIRLWKELMPYSNISFIERNHDCSMRYRKLVWAHEGQIFVDDASRPSVISTVRDGIARQYSQENPFSGFDLIIDSRKPKSAGTNSKSRTLEYLWRYLKDNGIYVIERVEPRGVTVRDEPLSKALECTQHCPLDNLETIEFYKTALVLNKWDPQNDEVESE